MLHIAHIGQSPEILREKDKSVQIVLIVNYAPQTRTDRHRRTASQTDGQMDRHSDNKCHASISLCCAVSQAGTNNKSTMNKE